QNVKIVSGSRTHLEVMAPERTVIEPRIFLYTAGFNNAVLFKLLHDISLPIRFWKSHLVVLPRVAQNGVFYLDPLEAAMMHHGRFSIVGLNEDARECDGPSYATEPECVEAVWEALARLIRERPGGPALPIACTKVDVLPYNVETIARRSLETFYREEIPGHIWVLPGKMTEAPFVVDQVVRDLCDRYPDPRISNRPCDSLVPLDARSAMTTNVVEESDTPLAWHGTSLDSTRMGLP
ncbi:MAG TPA: hypothetical protein VE871_03940, partial [Longimicrobium sp.]|nr:hypothetical protein [Longimicrobium sp.]